MRINTGIVLGMALVVLHACQPKETSITINGEIEGAAGKYLKYINMTKPGLSPDSLVLDMGGRFTLAIPSFEPMDFIFYLEPENSIRLTPLQEEIVSFKTKSNSFVESYSVQGSEESEKVRQLWLRNYRSQQIVDTMNAHYLAMQMHPDFDTIVNNLAYLSDSIFRADKAYYENFIREQPGSLASYIALSLKLNRNLNFFTLANDMPYFEMVDTALLNNYDTISMAKMLHVYVERGKMQAKRQQLQQKKSLMGKLAPELSLPNPYGDTLSLSSLKGKYVLVDFWGSWCRPCRIEHKNLVSTYNKYKRKGFEIYQVALEHSKQDWKNTIREDKLWWRYQVSELNYMDSKAAKVYQVKSLPANFLLDKEGTIIATNLFGDDLRVKLESLFNPVEPVNQELSNE